MLPPATDVAFDLAQRCLNLLKIPSVTGEETAITDHLEAWGKSLGTQAVFRHGNGLVLGKPDHERPCIALVGHTDTVPPHPDDDAPYRDGDRIVGLGASDMKCSLAVIQALFERCDLEALPFNLMAVFYDREEGPYDQNGLQPLLETCDMLRGVDLAVAMEPTDNTLQLGCMGGFQARITFKGRAAHSARPWEGDNAVHNAGPFLTELKLRPCREVIIEGLTFREAASVTLAQGGRARNVIPDTFVCNLNYRFAPEAPIEANIERVRQEILAMAQGAQVEFVDLAPPGPVPVGNPILAHWQTVVPMKVLPKQAWTDVARLATFGIDAVNFGPGMGAQAHQKGEWVSLSAMAQAYDMLWRFLRVPLTV